MWTGLFFGDYKLEEEVIKILAVVFATAIGFTSLGWPDSAGELSLYQFWSGFLVCGKPYQYSLFPNSSAHCPGYGCTVPVSTGE